MGKNILSSKYFRIELIKKDFIGTPLNYFLLF